MFLPVLAGGALLALAGRVAHGEIELDEPRREQLALWRDRIKLLNSLVGDFSPQKPSSWGRLTARVIDTLIEPNRRFDSPRMAREEMGFVALTPLPGFITTRLLESCPRQRVFARAGAWLDLVALGDDALLCVEGSDAPGSAPKCFTHEDAAAAQDALYDHIADAFWRGREAVLLQLEREHLSQRDHDLTRFRYRGAQLELIEDWRDFMRAGMRRNVLLQGPPGCGKTTLASHAARELSSRTLVFNATIFSQLSSSEWFTMLDVLSPEALLIDDVDRSDSMGRYGLEDRLRFFEEGHCDVPLVLFTSNEHTRLPEALRRPGRIDQIIRFGEPSITIQHEILDELAARVGVTIPDAERARLRALLDEYSAAHVLEALRRAHVHGWERAREDDVTFRLHRDFRGDSDWLQVHGFRELHTGVSFILNAVFDHEAQAIVFDDEHDRILGVTLPNGVQLLRTSGAHIYRGETFYFREELDGRAALCEGLSESFWRGRDAAMLDQITRDEMTVRPISLNGPQYYGPLLALIPRWERFRQQGLRRCALLQGPPGCGKSTFCLHAARELSSRTLVLTSAFFASISCGDWRELIELLRPEMLIVDDVDRVGSSTLEGRLRLLEEGYCEVPYILLTANDHMRLPDAMRRPGRIDEIHDVLEPDLALRARLIRELAAREGVEVPDEQLERLREVVTRLSTAHLVELLRRARVCGWDDLTPAGDVTFGRGEDVADHDLNKATS